MGYGYSVRIVEANRRGDSAHPGVILGKECIALDIPVNVVAVKLGVHRQSVYNWFTGATRPQPKMAERILELITTLKNS